MTSASITNSTAATGRLLPLEAAAPAEARGTLRTRTISEDSTCSSEAPPRRRGGRQKRSTNPNSGRRPNGRARQAAPAGRLWQFLLRLLNDAQYSPAVIRWEDKENGVFCFVHGHRVAEMWGQHKGNQAMNYEKMTRTMSRLTYIFKTFGLGNSSRLVSSRTGPKDQLDQHVYNSADRDSENEKGPFC
ncbi:ETS-related transcription factor Elf-1-like [Thrips palmi]|uniref:ETS-related transcription factor Elf-1-like n=1 Tax=Thrips palmi TaxID=161013 RepID=A0A6P8ZQE1_THRPL|nr:ETS-related transcription factor Elf-1-like [Thrips palmi]